LRIIEKTDACAIFKEFIPFGYPAWPILSDRLDEFSEGFSHVAKKLLGTAILSPAAKFASDEIASVYYLTQSSNAVTRSSFPPQDVPDKVFILLYYVTSLSTLVYFVTMFTNNQAITSAMHDKMGGNPPLPHPQLTRC